MLKFKYRIVYSCLSDSEYKFIIFINNFFHHQVTEKKNKQKTIYNKRRNTTDMLGYQAVTDIRVAYKINCK